MPHLQATWMMDGRLFFWAPDVPLDKAVAHDLPTLAAIPGERVRRELIVAGPPPRRHWMPGLSMSLQAALPALVGLPNQARVSDSVRCWAWMALLGLELAAQHRVVPSVIGPHASWRALLSRREDRQRFEMLVQALPTAGRAVAARVEGPIRLPYADVAARTFLDSTIDTLYRQGAWPGPGRGWALEFADALRGDATEFKPRDARYRGVPDAIAAWSEGAQAHTLQVGFELTLPTSPTGNFTVVPVLLESAQGEEQVALETVWPVGAKRRRAKKREFSVHAAMRGLARAVRIFPPLAQALEGAVPRAVSWDAAATWRFLSEGVAPLSDAGFEVQLPTEFARAGRHRIRARIRVGAPAQGQSGLTGELPYRWEVVLGDQTVDGGDFADLLARGEPIVRYRDQWVLLDPADVAKLPSGLPREGSMPAAEALRAVLTGEHEGVDVVADDDLAVRIEALRNPPDVRLPDGFRGTLRPYQSRGFAWLVTMGQLALGACLADDMGLGKTVQLIAYMLRRRQQGAPPTLVVCPTSVLGNWAREIRRFAPELKVLRYHGLQRDIAAIEGHDVVLTTYGLMVRDLEALGELPWDVVALDEAQAIKNPDSQRAKAARSLQAAHRVALSGTPVENRLDELWSLMEFLVPGLLGPRARFRRQVAVPIERFGDEAVADRLKRGVSPFLLRRLKTDPTVISDLPDKIEGRRYCPLTAEQAALYQRAVDESMERIADSAEHERRGHVLAMLTRLKQVCNHPAQLLGESGPLDDRSGKLERCRELVEQILEGGERAILFTQYREMGNLLQAYFSDLLEAAPPFLHGGTSAQARDEMVEEFQSGQGAPLLVVSLRAGGTGLNLTSATHVIHYDRWWNPAVEDQATDRAYRIGQKQNVHVHKLVCQDTLEERIDMLLEEKRALAEQVVGSGERWVTEMDDDALRRLVLLGEDAVVEDA